MLFDLKQSTNLKSSISNLFHKSNVQKIQLILILIAIFSLGLTILLNLTYMPTVKQIRISNWPNQVNSNGMSNKTRLMVEAKIMRRLPGALIIGSRKSGTRALLKFLELNPKIRAARSEVHFFDRPKNYQLGLDWYKSRMPESLETDLTIEKSPAYFVSGDVAEKVHAMNSSIRLVLIIRDPVTRLISDFSQILSNRIESFPKADPSILADREKIELFWSNGEREFESLVLRPDGYINEDWRPIKVGMYSTFLEKWLKFFPVEQVHFVDGEALIQTPYREITKVESFLGLKSTIKPESFVFNYAKGFYCIARNVTSDINDGKSSRIKTDCLSKNKGRRHIKVRDDIVQQLRDLYRPYNQYFFSLIKKDFGWRYTGLVDPPI